MNLLLSLSVFSFPRSEEAKAKFYRPLFWLGHKIKARKDKNKTTVDARHSGSSCNESVIASMCGVVNPFQPGSNTEREF